jgi:hypothetical protein
LMTKSDSHGYENKIRFSFLKIIKEKRRFIFSFEKCFSDD